MIREKEFGIYGTTYKWYVSETFRARMTRGLGFHAIARECRMLFPCLQGRDCKAITDLVFTALIQDNTVSLAKLTGHISAMVSDGLIGTVRCAYYSARGGMYLEPYEVAIGLMDMARGYSKKWD